VSKTPRQLQNAKSAKFARFSYLRRRFCGIMSVKGGFLPGLIRKGLKIPNGS
jgi:hypothetical protein